MIFESLAIVGGNGEQVLDAFALGGLGAFFAAFFAVFLIVGLALYVFKSLALMTIARKLKHPSPWLAWIPFADVALILQLGDFHWAWVFLLLVPVVGWIAVFVLTVISFWRIFEARKYPGALSLIWIGVLIPQINWLALIASLVVLGFVAWKDK